MASFFEKLKKGMTIETVSDEEELIEETDKEQNNNEDVKEEIEPPVEKSELEEIPQIPLGPEELKPEELEERLKEDENGQKIENASLKDLLLKNIVIEEESPKKGKLKKKEMRKNISIKEEKTKSDVEHIDDKKWFSSEGQLVVDVYETNGYLVIQSAIAGINPNDLDISIENDVVIIKGKREKTVEKSSRNYFSQECHWGYFSREIILPVEADSSKAEAIMKNGILTIRMPKIEKEKKKISVK
jgi:HSP20 family protein